MPQDLFKWEDDGGLKHHCPICQTPLSHPKCKTVCLGNHVEWCHRYHTLFRKNWSTRCSACKNTDEQHEKRHREIAEILARIRKLKAEEEAAAMELLASPATPKTPRTPLTAKALNSVTNGPNIIIPFETPKVSKKDRKAAKKAAKALERDKVVTTADIQLAAKILHPNGEKEGELDEAEVEQLGEDLEIRMNLKFNNSTCNAKAARHEFIVKDREQNDVGETEISRILSAFDVDPNASGKEGELVNELITAIKKDLVCFYDELKMVARNKAGFWRWANKRAYREVVENGKEWDAKNHWERFDEVLPVEERRDSDVANETDEDARSRNGSVDSSIAESAGTSLTVPSTKPGSSSQKEATSSGGTKKAPVPESKIIKKDPETEDPGWTQVGKKVLKPQLGKLTLSTNGGLHHFNPAPKGKFGALTIEEEAMKVPRPVVEPAKNGSWANFQSK